MMRKRLALLASLAIAAGGCGEEIERGEAVPLDKLPPGAMETARKALPDVKFDIARKARFNGQEAIEIRGKDRQGKVREVEVDPAGKILEIE